MSNRAAMALWLLAPILALTSPAAQAQHGFIPPSDRPLHARLAVARVVAFATVAEVGVSRIRFENAVGVVGRIEAEFELKRSPSQPPPWIVGDRAVLLLAGARSPYLWVDRPEEALTVDDPASEERIAKALQKMDAARVDGRARRDLYAAWSDGADPELAAAGHRGLMDVDGMVGILDGEFARSRAEVAANSDLPIEVRRRAARVAARQPEGVAALLRYLDRAGGGIDLQIAEIALQSGLLARDPDVETHLVDLLDAPETDLGRVGLRLAAFARGPEVERKLSELAVGHPDPSVRDEAVQSLKRMRRTRPRRS